MGQMGSHRGMGDAIDLLRMVPLRQFANHGLARGAIFLGSRMTRASGQSQNCSRRNPEEKVVYFQVDISCYLLVVII